MTVANPSDYEFETGLEDFDSSDAVIPRLSIVHKSAQFKDSLSNELFDKLNVVILGMVKQRVLWHPDVDDDDWPMCRSVNFEVGIPNLSDKQPKEKVFPWDKAGFRPGDFPADDNDVVRLPCANCQLKEWKSHPDGKKPYCTEQWTLPVFYAPDPDDLEVMVPAVITFQKTGLKPLKSYITSFARSKQPPFTAITEIGLEAQRKGSTDYAVPMFRRVASTDEANWRDYSTNYRTIRDFLTEEPGSRDEGSAPSSSPASTPDDPWATPKNEDPPAAPAKEEPVDAVVVEDSVAAPSPAAPEAKEASTPAPAAPAADDDLPF